MLSEEELKIKSRIASKKWKDKNKDKVYIYHKNWVIKNREKIAKKLFEKNSKKYEKNECSATLESYKDIIIKNIQIVY